MQSKKMLIGLISGISAAILIALLPLQGLSPEGKTCLSLTILTVILWAFQVAQAGYVSGLLLALMVILKVAEPATVFYAWIGTTMYLIIGAYLIASAVKTSGLGERIAYFITSRFMRSYASMIGCIFLMTLALSLIIPHPWPRAFLIMSVMTQVIKTADIPKSDAVKVGFGVFAASVPLSLAFLTGDSTINPLALAYAGVELGWLGWFRVMGVPALIASALTCGAFLLVFKPSQPVQINRQAAKDKLKAMGAIRGKELKTLIWLCIAVTLWATDSLHHIDIGWITLLIAMLMALPYIGGLLTPKSWNEVPVQVLVFITAAMAIGKVGAVTGMNQWLAQTLLPSAIPDNPFIFAAFVTVISVVIHMLLGSVIAVMGVAVPAVLAYTAPTGMNPLIPSLMVLTAIMLHYVFPFQNMCILVGLGEENGLYSQKESIRFSLPLLGITFITTALAEVLWWKLIGLW